MIDEQTLLLVDDSENDILLMQRAFKKAELSIRVHEARDGEEAIAYLKGDGIYADRDKHPLPSIVLLDLNMPKKNGLEVLEWAREQAAFKSLPIIILTASMRPADVERTYELGATAFLIKPSNTEALVALARSLRDWSRVNYFPPMNGMVTR